MIRLRSAPRGSRGYGRRRSSGSRPASRPRRGTTIVATIAIIVIIVITIIVIITIISITTIVIICLVLSTFYFRLFCCSFLNNIYPSPRGLAGRLADHCDAGAPASCAAINKRCGFIELKISRSTI